MILFVVFLLIVWLVVVLFYAYVRCTDTVRNSPRRVDAGGGICSRGLDPTVVNAITTFAYESKIEGLPLECAICLSKFEDGETGRVMPDCRHFFHLGCIDMWLQSHRDCPLCRNRVKVPGMGDPVRPVENSQNGAVSVHIQDPGPGSGWISALPLFLFAL